jgi:DNA replication initiation complex subunit (GINS family)
MAEKEVVITYETLFELLRLEKSREELQKLSDTFFEDLISYVNNKKTRFESKESQGILFQRDEREIARQELENIKKIVKEIYDRREKKIIANALNKARTGITLIDTSKMLASEKILFSAVSSVLTQFREKVLFELANGRRPNTENLSDSLSLKISTGSLESPLIPPGNPDRGADIQKEFLGHQSALYEPKELKTTPNFSEKEPIIRKVRFLQPIGEIVGPDLRIYGPYEEGSVEDLPNELARVLFDRKQAENI